MSIKEKQELSELIVQAAAGDKAALETVLAGVPVYRAVKADNPDFLNGPDFSAVAEA